jgi:adenylate cyclase
VEDNTLQIADGSVSSHHAEIVLRGTEILIRDLGSTNGTYINNEKITESVLKPGQTLRFGQVELKIDDGRPVSAPAPASAAAPVPAPAPTPSKKTVEGTMIIPRGVSLEQLEQAGTRVGFDTKGTGFSKKTNKVNTYFLIGGVIVILIILALIIIAVKSTHQ